MENKKVSKKQHTKGFMFDSLVYRFKDYIKPKLLILKSKNTWNLDILLISMQETLFGIGTIEILCVLLKF